MIRVEFYHVRKNGKEPNGLEVMNSYSIKRGIFHSFSGPVEMIDELNDNEFYISYGITERALSGNRRECFEERIARVHDDLLILEVDVLENGNFSYHLQRSYQIS